MGPCDRLTLRSPQLHGDHPSRSGRLVRVSSFRGPSLGRASWADTESAAEDNSVQGTLLMGASAGHSDLQADRSESSPERISRLRRCCQYESLSCCTCLSESLLAGPA